jgi:hypothetical protein
LRPKSFVGAMDTNNQARGGRYGRPRPKQHSHRHCRAAPHSMVIAAAVEWRWRGRSGSGGAAVAAVVEIGALVVTVLLFLSPVWSLSTPPPPLPPPCIQCSPTVDRCRGRCPRRVIDAAIAASHPPGVQCRRDVPPLT